MILVSEWPSNSDTAFSGTPAITSWEAKLCLMSWIRIVGNPGCEHDPPPRVLEDVPVEVLAIRTAEDQLALQVLDPLERRHHGRRHGEKPRLAGLRRPRVPPVVALPQVDAVVDEVEIAPTQAEDLAQAHPGLEPHEEERVVVGLDLLGLRQEHLGLPGVVEVVLPSRQLEPPHPSTRVCRQVTPLDRSLEHRRQNAEVLVAGLGRDGPTRLLDRGLPVLRLELLDHQRRDLSEELVPEERDEVNSDDRFVPGLHGRLEVALDVQPVPLLGEATEGRRGRFSGASAQGLGLPLLVDDLGPQPILLRLSGPL